MIRSQSLAVSIFVLAGSVGFALAESPTAPAQPVVTQPVVTQPAVTQPAPASADSSANVAASPKPQDPVAMALREKLDALPKEGSAQEIKERAVLSDFYAARGDAPLWVSDKGLSEKAAAIVTEIGKAHDWGLDPHDFTLPAIAADAKAPQLDASAVADAEVKLSLAILKYARFARGGRIIDPTILLSPELDRKPQLLDPEVVIRGIAAADAPDAYLRGLNPKHPQFEMLRQAYLATHNKALANKLLANMEEWRWMPDDLGDMHILANIPEFIVRLFKDGKVIHSERIVVGEVDKQTTIFTRNLKTIVFKPMWRVPESIKVRELLPNLRRGGSMFRQYDLELQSKDGKPLDYRSIDWNTADIRDYEVVQPPGRKNVMGVVKFTFPSQYTIFMHDTVDKWMFNQKVRTLSHGCMRLRNPMKMAELVLAEDKGWDAAKVDQTESEGPRNNEIVIDHKIPVHLVYFTAWVDDGGKVRTFADIYGHEKRITQALQGKWDKIDVGPNPLAPVEPVEPASSLVASGPGGRYRRTSEPSIIDIVGNALSGGL
jgi:L,D-transpeptidase YcbB